MKRFWATLAVLALIVAMSGGTAGAAAPGSTTCSGGSSSNMSTIPAGTYTGVTVTGICHILGAVTGPMWPDTTKENITNCKTAGGAVNILGKLTIAPNAFLDAGSCAPAVTVGGNVSVGSGGTLILGCAPNLVVTPVFPPFPTLCPGIITHDSIGGNVTADQPLAVIFHKNTINGNVSVHGGGGGLNCPPEGGALNFPGVDLNLSAALDSAVAMNGNTAAYNDFEDNTIGGGVSISGLQGCWFGIFRNQVHGNVSLDNNTLADPDAMEVTDNIVAGNLICFGNSPTVHLGDSGGGPNIVTGRQLGQCTPPLPM